MLDLPQWPHRKLIPGFGPRIVILGRRGSKYSTKHSLHRQLEALKSLEDLLSWMGNIEALVADDELGIGLEEVGVTPGENVASFEDCTGESEIIENVSQVLATGPDTSE